MGQRLELHAVLKALLPEGKKYIYFQAPGNTAMQYPCIMYSEDGVIARHANDGLYSRTKRYQVTIIDEDPDTEIPDKVANLPLSAFRRRFVADRLNHYIYNLYF